MTLPKYNVINFAGLFYFYFLLRMDVASFYFEWYISGVTNVVTSLFSPDK